MTNFEFYANEIKSRGFNFAVDKSNGELFSCNQEGSCNKCEFCPVERICRKYRKAANKVR